MKHAVGITSRGPVRQAATASLVLGGGLMASAAVLGAITVAEAFWARERLTSKKMEAVPPRTGVFGEPSDDTPIELAMLGDSLAFGFGAENPDETIGVLLAKGLAAAARRQVRLSNVAVIGSESRDLPAQIGRLAERDAPPAVAVIVIGGNEVMRLHAVDGSVAHLSQAVRDLRAMGSQVVVATCPDLGTVRPFIRPLRYVAHWLSRLLATAQTIVVLRAGGRTVSLADTLGPLFWRQPDVMFSTDQLHPSSHGYASAAEVLLPSVCAAAGYRTGDNVSVPHRIYRRGVRSPLLGWLAFQATRRSGMETSAGRSGGGPVLETRRRRLLRFREWVPRPARVRSRDTAA